MKINGILEITDVDKWSINWKDDTEKFTELKQLEIDIKNAISDRCGIDISTININLNIDIYEKNA